MASTGLYTQSELANLLNQLKTNHNLLLAKLDADTLVNNTDYAALHTTTIPSLPVSPV